MKHLHNYFRLVIKLKRKNMVGVKFQVKFYGRILRVKGGQVLRVKFQGSNFKGQISMVKFQGSNFMGKISMVKCQGSNFNG